MTATHSVSMCLIPRYREQARSHRFLWRVDICAIVIMLQGTLQQCQTSIFMHASRNP